MPEIAKLRKTVDLALTAEDIARAFCDLDDDAQAQFFVHCARIAEEWTVAPGSYRGMQWFNVGRHLRDCDCSTEEGREMIRDIASAMEPA